MSVLYDHPITHECVLNVKSFRPLPPFTLSGPPPSPPVWLVSSSSETAPRITTLSGSKSGSMYSPGIGDGDGDGESIFGIAARRRSSSSYSSSGSLAAITFRMGRFGLIFSTRTTGRITENTRQKKTTQKTRNIHERFFFCF